MSIAGGGLLADAQFDEVVVAGEVLVVSRLEALADRLTTAILQR